MGHTGLTGGGCDIDCVVLGELQTNCYVVRPTGQSDCWVFDPARGIADLTDLLASEALDVRRIIVTHGHGDHIGGVAELKQAFPDATFTAPAGDEPMLGDAEANLSGPFGMPVTAPPPDERVHPGQELRLGQSLWQVLDTSGHTPGGVSFYCRQAGVVVAGDALFAGSIGRCDLPGADFDQLIANIRGHLLTLPDETRVLCGHGPPTRIGVERRSNPYLQSSGAFD